MEANRDLRSRLGAMLDDYLALGNRVENAVQARFVSWPETPSVWDANHASRVRARRPAEIDALLVRAVEIAGQSGWTHRYFLCDGRTPPEFEARLVLDGYTLRTELELVLKGPLRASPRDFGIRPVESADDWGTIARLARANHLDDARRRGTPVYDESVAAGLCAARRRRAPEERRFVARVDGVDCAHFSSWPGRHGIGKVEDLFTLPAFRHRGIATALIAHAVDDARAGSGPRQHRCRSDGHAHAHVRGHGVPPRVRAPRLRVRSKDERGRSQTGSDRLHRPPSGC